MIDRTHALPVKRQTKLVGISRRTVYYHPEPISDVDLRLMRRIDDAEPGTAVRRQPHACATCSMPTASTSGAGMWRP